MRPITLLLAAALLVGGCGSSDDDAPPPRTIALAIADFKFVPEDVTVPTGTRVRWTNMDVAPHTATADDGSFDTRDLAEGETGAETLSKPGTYTYFCEFHRFMRAKITVR